jgi:sarcosine oxidase/L-pipecolate oxidase
LQYTNCIAPGYSAPRSQAEHPTDGIPAEAAAKIRRFLGECMPELAARPFVLERLCWDAETMDANFLITKHPK